MSTLTDVDGLIVNNVQASHEHRMVSVRTGSALIPFIERCGKCDWIDEAALTRAAEHAIKSAGTTRAQNIAVAIGTEPFAFVVRPGQDLDINEVLGQALGAASMCWEFPDLAGEFDSTRAAQIYAALRGEVGRAIREAVRAGGENDG